MSKRSIEIERLEIRLRGATADAARASAAGLGHALMEELATMRKPSLEGASVHEGGREETGAASDSRDASDLQRIIARRVAASVRERLNGVRTDEINVRTNG